MNFVIPMAGRGQRFADAGYTLPKMLIEVHGKTLMQWSIDSLPLHLCTNMVCILLDRHEEEFNLSQKIKEKYGHLFNIEFYMLDQITRGQAETVYLSKDLYKPSLSLLIYNIGTFFQSHTLERHLLQRDIDGVIGSFKSVENRFSFAVTDERGLVTQTARNEVISNNALTGLHFFSKLNDFLETAEYHIKNDLRTHNEFYITPMYNYLIQQGKKFIIDVADQHVNLDTPEELDKFLHIMNYGVL